MVVYAYLNLSPLTGLACKWHLIAIRRAFIPTLWWCWLSRELTQRAATVSKVLASSEEEESLVICSNTLSKSWWPSFNLASNSYKASSEWVGSEASQTPPSPVCWQIERHDPIFSKTDSSTLAYVYNITSGKIVQYNYGLKSKRQTVSLTTCSCYTCSLTLSSPAVMVLATWRLAAAAISWHVFCLWRTAESTGTWDDSSWQMVKKFDISW